MLTGRQLQINWPATLIAIFRLYRTNAARSEQSRRSNRTLWFGFSTVTLWSWIRAVWSLERNDAVFKRHATKLIAIVNEGRGGEQCSFQLLLIEWSSWQSLASELISSGCPDRFFSTRTASPWSCFCLIAVVSSHKRLASLEGNARSVTFSCICSITNERRALDNGRVSGVIGSRLISWTQ